jgi:hypothetical protein
MRLVDILGWSRTLNAERWAVQWLLIPSCLSQPPLRPSPACQEEGLGQGAQCAGRAVAPIPSGYLGDRGSDRLKI